MKISLRRISGIYQEVIVEDGDTLINIGLLDKDEARELAEHLRNVAANLSPAEAEEG